MNALNDQKMKLIKMKKPRRINPNTILKTFLLVGIVGLIIGSFADLKISQLLYMRAGFYPNFFRLTGEMPMILTLVSVSFAQISNTIKRDDKSSQEIILIVLALLAILIAPFISAGGIINYFAFFKSSHRYLIYAFYLITGFFLSKLYNRLADKEIRIFFIFALSVVILSILSMSILKDVWSRARFHPMHVANDYSDFSPWYLPQFRANPIDDYRSFPSGHTTSATTMLMLLYLPFDRLNQSEKKWITAFSISWPLLVALARILDGAHYLSDVSAAFILSSGLIFLAMKIVDLIKKKFNIPVSHG